MRVDDAGFGGGPNSSITFNQNSISGYSIGLEEDAGGYMGGSLDATKNWWGSSTGPTIASNPGGTGALIIDQDGGLTTCRSLLHSALALRYLKSDRRRIRINARTMDG